MLLDIRKSKSGSALVLTDPGGDVHACVSAEELWETLTSVLADPDMPKAETVPPPPIEEKDGNGGGNGPRTPDELADALIGQYGGRVVEGLLGGLRKMSHRDGGKKSQAGGGGG